MQKKLINKKLLTSAEVDWVNNYHKQVRESVKPLLKDDPNALAYLERETTPL